MLDLTLSKEEYREYCANLEQGTDAWKRARIGKVTASRIHDIMPGKKGAYLASRKNYMAELLLERLTGTWAEGFVSAPMKWGTDHESDARDAYKARQGVEVEEVGFVPDKDLHALGASPDGLVGLSGMVEIKCPNSATHLETLRGGGIAPRYYDQMQAQMLCCGREWCDFVSFDPRFPADLQLYVKRVNWDCERAQDIASEVVLFLDDLHEAEKDLHNE